MSTTRPAIVLAALLALALPACGSEDGPTPTDSTSDTITFQEGEMPFGGFAFSSGQPSEARLRELAPHVARVVNFRMPDEHDAFDEAAVVAEAGGTYASIPFDVDTLREAEARKRAYAAFDAAAEESSKLTWFHCSSANRVGALWALYRAEVEGKPAEEAIADGRAAGLTKLEPLVREILGVK